MGTNIYPKAKKAEENDYVKFKRLLRFLVRQLELNIEKGLKTPTRKNGYKKGTYIVDEDHEFEKEYGLELGFNEIAGLHFTIRFFMNGWHDSPKVVYINIEQFNIIIEKFENKKIIELKNSIKLDIENKKHTERYMGGPRNRCDDWNKTQKPYSTKVLGINDDNYDPVSEELKEMLDEYLKGFNALFEDAENSVTMVYK
jgi:hypothetical protein